MYISVEKMSLDWKMHAWRKLNIDVAEDRNVHTN